MICGVFFNREPSSPVFANTLDLDIPLDQLSASTRNGVVVDVEKARNHTVSTMAEA
jgi:hypothetical protein